MPTCGSGCTTPDPGEPAPASGLEVPVRGEEAGARRRPSSPCGATSPSCRRWPRWLCGSGPSLSWSDVYPYSQELKEEILDRDTMWAWGHARPIQAACPAWMGRRNAAGLASSCCSPGAWTAPAAACPAGRDLPFCRAGLTSVRWDGQVSPCLRCSTRIPATWTTPCGAPGPTLRFSPLVAPRGHLADLDNGPPTAAAGVRLLPDSAIPARWRKATRRTASATSAYRGGCLWPGIDPCP